MSTYNYNPYAYYYNGYNATPQQLQPQSPNILYGHLVDSIESAKIADVPVGSYGIFPKGDLSEIYIKTWNSNGTTNLLTYKLAEGQQPASPEDNFSQITNKLNELSEKIDALTTTKQGVRASDY